MQVNCDEHGVVDLSPEQIDYYNNNADEEYRCPICHAVSELVEEEDDSEELYDRDTFVKKALEAIESIQKIYSEEAELPMDIWITNYTTQIENS